MEIAQRHAPNMPASLASAAASRLYRRRPLPPGVIIPPEGTDQETYDLLIQMQLEELEQAAPAPHQANPGAQGDEMDDEAFARMLQEQENSADIDIRRANSEFNADLKLARKLQGEEDAAAEMARLKVADNDKSTLKRKRSWSESDDDVIMVAEWTEKQGSKNRKAGATADIAKREPIARRKRKRANSEEYLVVKDNNSEGDQKQKQANPVRNGIRPTNDSSDRRNGVETPEKSPQHKDKEEEVEGENGEQDNDWAYDKKPPRKEETGEDLDWAYDKKPPRKEEAEEDLDWAYDKKPPRNEEAEEDLDWAYDKKPPRKEEKEHHYEQEEGEGNVEEEREQGVFGSRSHQENSNNWEKARMFDQDADLAARLAKEEDEGERRDRELALMLHEEEKRQLEEERRKNQESLQLVEKLIAEEREESNRLKEALVGDEEVARQMMAEWEHEEEERELQMLIKENECYICLDHEDTVELEDGLVAPLKQLYERVAAMALQRKAQEEPQPVPAPIFNTRARGRNRGHNQPQQQQHNPPKELDEEATDQLLRDFVYYMCAKCKGPYYGGRRQCQVAQEEEPEVAQDRICNMCANKDQTQAAECSVAGHGTQYVEYKCRYCCNVANFFCWGTTHFCEMCHRKTGKVQLAIIPCPGLPACAGHHPPNDGKEHCLGCALCRDVATH